MLQPGGRGPSVREQVILGRKALEPLGVHDDEPVGESSGVEHSCSRKRGTQGEKDPAAALLRKRDACPAADDDGEPDASGWMHDARAHRQGECHPRPSPHERGEPGGSDRERDHARMKVVLERVHSRLRHAVPDAHREHEGGRSPAGAQQRATKQPSRGGDGQQHEQVRAEQHLCHRQPCSEHDRGEQAVDEQQVVLHRDEHAVAREQARIDVPHDGRHVERLIRRAVPVAAGVEHRKNRKGGDQRRTTENRSAVCSHRERPAHGITALIPVHRSSIRAAGGRSCRQCRQARSRWQS